MIKEIRLTNFYSFKESTIELSTNTNVLIGINGSGKSNLLKVVRLLMEGVSGMGLKKYVMDVLGGFDNIFFKGEKNTRNEKESIIIEFVLRGDDISDSKNGFRFTDDIIYRIELIRLLSGQNFYVSEKITNETGFLYLSFTNGIGHLNERVDSNNKNTKLIKYDDFDSQELVLKEISDNDRYYALTTLKKAIREIAVYDYFDTTPKSLIRKPMLPTSDKRLNGDGTNLPQILNTIKINDKGAYRQILEMLHEVNEKYSGLDFNFIGGSIELMIEEEGLNSAVHVSSISDGTLRYLCLLSILLNPERGRFICIDEPGVGLHPDMILNITNAIKEASKKSTLVISTHSENLLDQFEIEDIKVFDKDAENSTQVISYTKDQFEGWYEEFSLGKMWRNGDLSGVRYGG